MAVVLNQTKSEAAMVAELKDVTTEPVVVEVVAVPPVTTSVPVADLSDPFLTVQVTDGVADPLNTATISVIV